MNKKTVTDRKVLTFGEVMFRLITPRFRRFSQFNELLQSMVAGRLMLLCRWHISASLWNLSPVCRTMP